MTWQSFDRRQKWKFYWLMETIAHYNGFPLKVTSKCKCIMLKKFIRSKTKSTVTILLPLWHWMSFENWKLSESKLLPSFFHWSLKKKNTLQKATCQDNQVWVCLLSYNLLKDLLSLRQNVSNLCQSFFVFLTVHLDKIFKYLDGILFFNKIMIQFLHLLCSQNSTGLN